MELNHSDAAPERLVLITGASGGIGLVLTSYLLEAGWRNLVCQYRSRPEEIGCLLRKHGLDPACRLFRADLTQEDQVSELRRRIGDSFGSVYGLVNLAGSSTNRLAWKMPIEEFRQIMDANLLTMFLACREFIPGMRQQQLGRIVNISSVVAYTGSAGAAHYCAAKAGAVGLSKALALELAPKNIAVSVIALGFFQYGLINTLGEDLQEQIRARIPAARFGRGEELGGLVHYLLGDTGAYAGGQVYHLNGGLYG